MKKNILFILLMIVAGTATATERRDTTLIMNKIDNGYRWFLQAHINGSYSANEDLRQLKFSKSLGWGADFSVGYATDYWGGYLQLAYNKNRGAQFLGYDDDTFSGFTFSSLEPTINVSYNLSNSSIFGGFKPGRRNNFYLHLGVGAAFSFSSNACPKNVDGSANGVSTGNHTTWTSNVGVNYTYNLNNTVAFTADLTGHVFGDKFNGASWQIPVDGRFNLGVGLKVYISRNSRASSKHIIETREREIRKTITITDTIKSSEQDVFSIFFDYNSDMLKQSQYANVRKVAEALQKNPNKVVYVLGYADKETETDNAKLAKTRADVVTNELKFVYGVDASRIVTHDMGDNVQPFLNIPDKNRTTLCIITDLKHE